MEEMTPLVSDAEECKMSLLNINSEWLLLDLGKREILRMNKINDGDR